FSRRDPPVLPYLKQEEPNGISTSQPEFPAFQYILCAPTSPAVRHHEETLTYLNQGDPCPWVRPWAQPVSVGPAVGSARGRRCPQSVVRVSFHDRRLQYSEQQQLEGWRWSRPGDRILDIGGTEFTLRKNGGEKGVPFRIQIDTFGAGGKGDPPEHLHSASCLVKVFKPKGADRKLKTDREKVEKQPPPEREKFQPSYESTVLAEVGPGLGAPSPRAGGARPGPSAHDPPPPSVRPVAGRAGSPPQPPGHPGAADPSPPQAAEPREALSPCASPLETQQWLLRRRFSGCARVFASFTGADLLKLSRRDLIQICGAPDGIRLCHALVGRSPRPRLTLYVAREPGGAEAAEDGGSGGWGGGSGVWLYQELHLEQLTVAELTGKLAELLGLPPGQILRLSRQGPSGIHVLVSD
ncbi:TFCP2 factor, partial [Onychorhynchus coronatus]|nr:TFCP2 factor [Onychorhynchus coronatus]